jgi:ppGpp synthetase/RelA/SpoT-type nucleotidyltranferase
MLPARTADDLLRAEYFTLVPGIRRSAEELEAEVRHLLIPISRQLESHERVVIKSRVKDCESAIAALRRRQEIWDFENSPEWLPSLTSLKDLAGVRILAFPKCRVLEIDAVLRQRFGHWTRDPVPAVNGTSNSLALKYYGRCSEHCRVHSEIQLMSMLASGSAEWKSR